MAMPVVASAQEWRCAMSALAEKLIASERSYNGSREAIEVVRELERRRSLAKKNPERLLDGDAHLEALLASRKHV